ncbi:hypothetical protein SORBI_3010G068200 [Sorghum bicolor]|uniref:Fe2OG dioxygenase domain-containing protein n=1 Tax=Sorghum bicolor TaxID=4558 RepID=A0A194YHR1_SORBI|nr:hypothetical protein SORBI_3010G068200 [Sorghum bicolor]
MAHAEAGGSLAVPNVQALAETYNRSDEQIPGRYIRDEEAAEEVIVDHDISSAIPIIDVNKLLDPQSSKEECAKLGSACKHWGFFQVINHGVPNEVICNFRNDITEFFKQPLEAKMAYSMIPGNLQGYGQHFVVSENQKLDWADLFGLVLRPIDSRDMRFWPSHPPSFRNSVDRYSSEAAKLVSCLLKFLAVDMGVEPESFLEIFRGQPQSMRMTYYPPCKQASKVVGLSPHTDRMGLTLLLQANDVQGLQIRKDGKWVAINALDGAFIVNVGDTLEILSNGRYKSIEHRAMVHPTRERMSAALFHAVYLDATVGPLPELVKNDAQHQDFPKTELGKLSGKTSTASSAWWNPVSPEKKQDFLPVDSSWRSIAKHGVRRRIGVPLDEERDSIGDHASFAHVMRALCLLLLLLAGPGLQRERQRLHTDTRMFMCDLPLPAYGPALPFWD